ncbi:MAG: hypothetical protein ACKVT1_14880 [Dehalococcoidia bacterium]
MRIDPVGPPLATLKLDLALEVLAGRDRAKPGAAPTAPSDRVAVTEVARALAAAAPPPAVLKLLIALARSANGTGFTPIIAAPVAANDGVRPVTVTARSHGGVTVIDIQVGPAIATAPAPAAPSPVLFEGKLADLAGRRFVISSPSADPAWTAAPTATAALFAVPASPGGLTAGLPLTLSQLHRALAALNGLEPAGTGAPAALTPAAVAEVARALAAGLPSPAVITLLAALVERVTLDGPTVALNATVTTDDGLRLIVVTARTSAGFLVIELGLRPGTPRASLDVSAPPVSFDGEPAELDGRRFLMPLAPGDQAVRTPAGTVVEQSLLAALAALQPPGRTVRRERPRRRQSAAGQPDGALAILLRSMGRSPAGEEPPLDRAS